MTTNQPAPQPAEAPTSDETERLLETARAAQVAGTFPSDSAIRLLTDDYGAFESEQRHCMAAARLALAYWGHAWGYLATNHPAPVEPADDLIGYQDFTELCAKHNFQCDDDASVETLHELVQEAIAADRARRATPPAEGEVGLLAEWMSDHAAHLRNMEKIGALPQTELPARLDRAADLLQQQAAELAMLRGERPHG